MKIRGGNKGFTLIELIVAIVVLSILSISSFSFIGNAVATYSMVREQRKLYSDAIYIMERITRELSDATTVTTSLNTLTFTPAHPRPSETTVEFRQSGTDLYRNANGNTMIIGRNMDTSDGFKVTTTAPTNSEETVRVTIELKLTNLKEVSIPSFVIKSIIPLNNYGTANYTGRSFNGDYYETIQ